MNGQVKAISTLRDMIALEKGIKKPVSNRKMDNIIKQLVLCMPGYLCVAFCIFMQRYAAACVCAVGMPIVRLFTRKNSKVSSILLQVFIALVIFFLVHFDDAGYFLAVPFAVIAFIFSLMSCQAHVKAVDEAKDQVLLESMRKEMAAKPDVPAAQILREMKEFYPVPEKDKSSLISKVLTVISMVLIVLLCIADPHISGTTGSGNYGQKIDSAMTKRELTYVECDGGVRLDSAGELSEGDIVIPEEYDGKPVVEIGDSAFAETNITSVVIPSNVVRIHARAFYGCSELTSVTMNEGLQEVGAYAFANCTALKSADIPSTVTELRAAAFANTAITEAEIPEGVKEIHALCFKDCRDLKNVKLPQGLKKISEYVFMNCVSLKNIDLPEELGALGPYAFNSTGLTEIVIPGSIGAIKEQCFAECASLREVSIKPGVTRVGARAFYGCRKLETVKCPWTMKTFRSSAFRSCSKNGLRISYPFYTYVADRVFKDTKVY